jgi:uncharacterized phiE125 gp8 family phage protein
MATTYKRREFSTRATTTAMGTEELALFRSHLHLEDTADNNTLIQTYRDAARQIMERELGSIFLKEGWELAIDGPPNGETIYLPKSPIIAVSSVTTYDQADSGTVFSSSNYEVDISGGRLFLAQSKVWPSDLREFRTVVVSYSAGFGTTLAELPPLLLQALLLFTGHLWENREDATMPRSVRQLVAPFLEIDS